MTPLEAAIQIFPAGGLRPFRDFAIAAGAVAAGARVGKFAVTRRRRRGR